MPLLHLREYSTTIFNNIHLNLKKQIQFFSGTKNQMNHRMFNNKYHKSTYQNYILSIGTYTGRFCFLSCHSIAEYFFICQGRYPTKSNFLHFKSSFKIQFLLRYSNFCCSKPKHLPLHSKHQKILLRHPYFQSNGNLRKT